MHTIQTNINSLEINNLENNQGKLNVNREL